mgnify:CR=1 FL=1
MKKLLSLIVCVLMISGCQDASINRIKKDNSLSGLHEITYDELKAIPSNRGDKCLGSTEK